MLGVSFAVLCCRQFHEIQFSIYTVTHKLEVWLRMGGIKNQLLTFFVLELFSVLLKIAGFETNSSHQPSHRLVKFDFKKKLT